MFAANRSFCLSRPILRQSPQQTRRGFPARSAQLVFKHCGNGEFSHGETVEDPLLGEPAALPPAATARSPIMNIGDWIYEGKGRTAGMPAGTLGDKCGTIAPEWSHRTPYSGRAAARDGFGPSRPVL